MHTIDWFGADEKGVCIVITKAGRVVQAYNATWEGLSAICVRIMFTYDELCTRHSNVPIDVSRLADLSTFIKSSFQELKYCA